MDKMSSQDALALTAEYAAQDQDDTCLVCSYCQITNLYKVSTNCEHSFHLCQSCLQQVLTKPEDSEQSTVSHCLICHIDGSSITAVEELAKTPLIKMAGTTKTRSRYENVLTKKSYNAGTLASINDQTNSAATGDKVLLEDTTYSGGSDYDDDSSNSGYEKIADELSDGKLYDDTCLPMKKCSEAFIDKRNNATKSSKCEDQVSTRQQIATKKSCEKEMVEMEAFKNDPQGNITDVIFCDICALIQNQNILAEFFCVDCQDRLCRKCSEVHCRTKLTVRHEIKPLNTPENRIVRKTVNTSHNSYSVNKERSVQANAMKELLKGLELKRKLLDRSISENQNQLKELEIKRSTTELEIETWAKNQQEIIKYFHAKMMDQLSNIYLEENKKREEVQYELDSELTAVMTIKMATNVNKEKEQQMLIQKALQKTVNSKISSILPSPVKFNFISLCPDYILKVDKQQSNQHHGAAKLLREFNTQLPNEEVACGHGIAMSLCGDVMVTDSKNKKIKLFSDGSYKSSVDYINTSDNFSLEEPHDIAVGQSGTILVTDNGGNKLVLLNDDYKVQSVFLNIFVGNGHVAIDSKNRVIISDYKGEEITLRDLEGKVHFKINKDSLGLDDFHPYYVTTTSEDAIVVSDIGNDCVYIITSSGKLQHVYNPMDVSKQLSNPWGVCVDMLGQIIIANRHKDEIQLVSSTGNFLGILATKEDGLDEPVAVTTDNDGYLYVLEMSGNVKVFKYEHFKDDPENVHH